MISAFCEIKRDLCFPPISSSLFIKRISFVDILNAINPKISFNPTENIQLISFHKKGETKKLEKERRKTAYFARGNEDNEVIPPSSSLGYDKCWNEEKKASAGLAAGKINTGNKKLKQYD